MEQKKPDVKGQKLYAGYSENNKLELVPVQESDFRKAYDLFMTYEKDENGFINAAYGMTFEEFLDWVELKRNWSMGKRLPDGFVPDTTYLLMDDDTYVGIFNLRHCLNDALRNGVGHIGYGISKKYRRQGYATRGLKLTLAEARKHGIHEAYLSVNKDNPGSLKAQLNNGAVIHHEDDQKYYTRISLIDEDSSREEIVKDFYTQIEEDERLKQSCHGRLEYAATMSYIHKYAKPGAKVLEVGAGTGTYSLVLAKEGMDVTAVELVEKNLSILKEKGKGLPNLISLQGDATKLDAFKDDTFDVTLVLGPMYHLYEKRDVEAAMDEAIRVTKSGGVLIFSFISVFAIMYANHFYGEFQKGLDLNFGKDYKVRHFKEQLFTGYDVTEFKSLFDEKQVEWITTAGVDGLVEPIEKRLDFHVSEEDFEKLVDWYLHFAEKRELLGHTNHLLYICKKTDSPKQ